MGPPCCTAGWGLSSGHRATLAATGKVCTWEGSETPPLCHTPVQLDSLSAAGTKPKREMYFSSILCPDVLFGTQESQARLEAGAMSEHGLMFH